MNRRKLGPPPDWIRTENPAEPETGEPTDPLKGIFNASRNARLGEQEDDVLLAAFRERRDAVTDAQVLAEVKALLVAERKRSEPFSEIHVAPTGTSDVADVRTTRLVILGTHHTHSGEGEPSVARKKAQAFLGSYGVGKRKYPNALLFLAPDAVKIQEFLEDLRAMLAWQGLVDTPAGRLEPRYAERARTHFLRCQERRDFSLREAYCWLLVPTQSQPDAPVVWREIRLDPTPGPLAEAAAHTLTEQGLLRADEGLADELGRVRAWLGDHINNPVRLAEEFARSLYLPRLADERILSNVLQTVLAVGISPRLGARRPFTATLRLDPNELAASGAVDPELLAILLAVINPADLKCTLQLEAQVTETQRRQLENALAERRNENKPAPPPTPKS